MPSSGAYKCPPQRIDDTYDARLGSLQDRVRFDQGRIDGFAERAQAAKGRLASRVAQQELRVRMDREALAELSRVEAERGGGAAAVQPGIFPAPGDSVVGDAGAGGWRAR